MKKPEFDKTKLPKVMQIIDKTTILIDETDYENDNTVKNKLMILDRQLKEITGKENISAEDFADYWAYTSLETVAKVALLPEPTKEDLSDEELREIITNIFKANHDEAQTGYWLDVLKVETGLNNISDYIFNPDEVGLALDASLETIIDKIMEDKK